MSQDNKKDNGQSRDQALDDFWDVGRLLPTQSKTPKYTPTVPRKTPEAVEIDVPPVSGSSVPQRKNEPAIRTVTVEPVSAVPLSFAHGDRSVTPNGAETTETAAETPPASAPEASPDLSYVPDSRLLHRVEVYEWHSNYHYFDQFVKDAAAYAQVSGKEAPRQSFFSYFPQYAQLNRRQRAWYLFWREQVRAGSYPETDYAYILLYLFELINLPAEGETAEHHRDLMAKVWVAYRKTYPQLDHYACEWLCDYCLIHQLTAPVLHLLPALGQILSSAGLKEFYLSSMISVGDEQVNLASAKILLTHCCQYDYKKSKFYSGEHRAMFDGIVPRAVAAVFPQLVGEGSQVRRGDTERMLLPDAQVTRDAYVGALCAYSNKRRIKVSFISFSRSHDLRFLVGDMVRHIENRIRAAILIRSRLTVHSLPPALRKSLDEWLNDHLPSHETAVRQAESHRPRPEYEALYDLPHTAVSIESADEIEQSSWETTKILVEAFGEDESEPAAPSDDPDVRREGACPSPTEEAPIQPCAHERELPTVTNDLPPSDPLAAHDHPLLAALGDRADFVRAVLRGDRAGQKDYCTAHKKLPDAVVDEINDLAVEHEIFDMVIEEDGRGGYVMIEDYRETVEEILDI